MNQLKSERTTVVTVLWGLIFFTLFDAGWVNAQEDPFESLTDAERIELLELLSQAEQAESDAQWSTALGLYEEMWALVPLDLYRYRQAHCLEQLERFVEALELYQLLVESETENVARNAGARVNVLETLVGNLPGTLLVTTQPHGALVVVNNVDRGVTTTGEVSFELPSGEHHLVVQLDNYHPFDDTVTVTAQQQTEVHVDLVPIEVLDDGGIPVLTIAFGGAAIAALSSSLVFGLLSNARADDEQMYDRGDPNNTRTEADDLADQAETFATVANISFISGAVFGVVATLVWLLDGDGDESDPPEDELGINAQPQFDDGYFGMALSWTF